MAELVITDELVAELISEVAPLVAEITHWELGMETLQVRVIPKERGYEEIVLRHMQTLGVRIYEDDPRDIFQRLLEYFIESNVLAAYLPAQQEIVIVNENVDDSNLDGLKLILGHELTHRAQHISHPDLYRQIEAKTRALIAELSQAGGRLDFEEFMETINEIQPLMTLIESHAMVVQHSLAEQHYPQAKIESHWNLATLLFKLVGAQKLAQYNAGVPTVMEAIHSGDLDELFQSSASG